jgi:hypothetical protein
MLVTGAVGSYLMGACWIVLLLTAAVTIMSVQKSANWFYSIGIGGGMISIMLWVAGCVCEGIGWIALRRLHPGVASFVGFATATLPGTYGIVLMMSAMNDSATAFHLLVWMQLTLYACVLAFILARTGDRARLMPATSGLALAMVGIIGVYLTMLVEPGSVASVVFVFAALGGMSVGHLALGNYFRHSAAMARALDSFR